MLKPGLLLITLALQLIAAEESRSTYSEILAKAQPSDWRPVEDDNLLIMSLPSGPVIIELDPQAAPQHVANIRALTRERYWDGLSILRVQDNYVVQWGDPKGELPKQRKKFKKAKENLEPEFDRVLDEKAPFKILFNKDAYAPEVGFVGDFPVGRNVQEKKLWSVHCYGAVGVGRGDAVTSGSGAELYAVIGHSPRALDRNVTLVGRILSGIERLSVLPRGTGAMGFYEQKSQYVPIRSIRINSDLPAKWRRKFEVLKTDTKLFDELVESRRNRREPWFAYQAGNIEICNMPIPTREVLPKSK